MAQTAALCSALLISASRISDNKHHPTDVMAGAALGVAVQGGTLFNSSSEIDSERYFRISIAMKSLWGSYRV